MPAACAAGLLALCPFDVFIEELQRAEHGVPESVGDIVVVPLVLEVFNDTPGLVDLSLQRSRKKQRDAFILGAVVELDRSRQVSQV